MQVEERRRGELRKLSFRWAARNGIIVKFNDIWPFGVCLCLRASVFLCATRQVLENVLSAITQYDGCKWFCEWTCASVVVCGALPVPSSRYGTDHWQGHWLRAREHIVRDAPPTVRCNYLSAAEAEAKRGRPGHVSTIAIISIR